MGSLALTNPRLAIATRNAVVQFADAPLLAEEYLPERPRCYDGLYLPRVSHFTGDLNVHDLTYGRDGLWLVNTRFSCLAKLSNSHRNGNVHVRY